ncbi:MAG: hypothetical protein U1G08_17155 [Verrucomicrobiota bacterium]
MEKYVGAGTLQGPGGGVRQWAWIDSTWYTAFRRPVRMGGGIKGTVLRAIPSQ